MLRALLRRERRPAIWLALLTLLGVALAGVPLFDVVGFESAFVLAVAVSFAGADLGAAAVRRAPASPLRAALSGWLRALGALAGPTAVLAANGARVPWCDPAGGLVFFAAMPGLSAGLAAAAGAVAGLVLWRTPRFAHVAAVLFVLLSIAAGVWRFYAAPPIFGYDPFAGYFPGTLYDEDIRLHAAFGWARLYHFALAGAALGLVTAWRTLTPALSPRERESKEVERSRLWRRPAAVAAVLAGLAAGLAARAPDLGFRASAGDIAAALGGRRETPHFVIHYAKGATFAADIDAIAADHELAYAILARELGVAPPRITSFYFADSEQKARWMGAGDTYIAKPWRREIYVQHEDFPHDTLRHEIAHVFAGEFGDPLLHISVSWIGWPPARFNVGLIEGAAVAVDGATRGGLLPHQAARALLDLGLLPSLDSLLTAGFLRLPAARSYTTAGSFCRFLLDRYGAARFRALYRSGGRPADFARVLGRPLPELERDWRAFLGAVAVSDEEKLAIADRLRRRAVFDRPCPHAVARRAREAEERLGEGDPAGAVTLLERVCADDPGEPAFRLALARARERAGDAAGAAAILEVIGGDEGLAAGPRGRALLLRLDQAGRAGDLAAARAALDKVSGLPLDEGTRRNLDVRRLALGGDVLAATLRGYVFAVGTGGRDADPVLLLARAADVSRSAPESGLGPYLEGRILEARGAWRDAALRLAAARALPLPPLVARETDRLLATSCYLAGDLDGAEAAAARLAADPSPAVAQEGATWLDRVTFRRHGSLP